MANPNIPNLCGANPNLNESLSKIEELKDKLLSNIDVDASTLKSELEEGLDELKGAFDKLEVELPEAPAVNFQAEVTSLINDIDKTSIAGLGAFNAKLASLKLDFGNTLEEKGIDFDSLIASAETKLSGGGNVCDTVNNLEIPAANSGTGITTETKEERGTGTSITLTDSPKSIVSVFGKRSGENFFGSASYKQSGRTITTTNSFEIIRVRYTVDLIKEKPIAVLQPDKDGEKEEVSIVSKNLKSVEKNVEEALVALVEALQSCSDPIACNYQSASIIQNNNLCEYANPGENCESEQITVGMQYQGGYVFSYDPSTNTGLIVSATDLGFGLTYDWGCHSKQTDANDALGQTNTTTIINSNCTQIPSAANVCNGYEINGISDWYLPSKEELTKLHNQKNLLHAQQGFTAFQAAKYWSSSEQDQDHAYSNHFGNGTDAFSLKSTPCYVRGIRSF